MKTLPFHFIVPWLLLCVIIVLSICFLVDEHYQNFATKKQAEKAQRIFTGSIDFNNSEFFAPSWQYDSCACVIVILPDGRYGTIHGDDCTPYTKAFHYTDNDLSLMGWYVKYKRDSVIETHKRLYYEEKRN